MVECIVLDSHSMEMLPSQEHADWLSEARNFLDTVEARLDNIDFCNRCKWHLNGYFIMRGEILWLII